MMNMIRHLLDALRSHCAASALLVICLLGVSPSVLAQAWVRLTGPAQTVYTAPATVSMTVEFGSTNGGPKSEYIDNVRLTQNGILVTNFAYGTYTVQGLPPGTYVYMLTAQGIRNLNGDEVVRSLSSGPVTITVNAPPEPIDSAEIVTGSFSTNRVVAGQPFNVSVTMKNTGETTWTPGGGYALAMHEAGWGVGSITVPGTVAPGQTATFNFVATPSPYATNGALYGIQFQMQRNGAWFGLATGQFSFFVWQPVNSAEFEAQSVPTAMKTGAPQVVTVRMKNTGDTTWQPGSYWLGSQNPTDSTVWGAARTALPRTVAPGESVDIPVTLQAPATPGTYNFQRQMWADGKGWFGPATPNVAINVSAPVNSARMEGGPMPLGMQTGSSIQMRLLVRNNGETTWTSAAGYALASENPADNTVWGTQRVALPSSVPPNGLVEFVFTITAPSTPGSYALQWRMNQEGVGRFGESTPNTNVQVTLPPVKGTWKEYDALGRVTSTAQDTNDGLAITVSTYQPGNWQTTVDPLGHTTQIQYQAFGTPAQSNPIAIRAPEGSFTDVLRDRYARPTAVIRRNADSSMQLRRSFAYGEGGTLCKLIEPETGTTVTAYDGAGNLAWSASGLNLPDPDSCDLAAAQGSGRQVTRAYDARNRIITLTFPDGNGNQSWSYTSDGLPAEVQTANDGGANHTINTYTYNKRRLLVGESTSQAGWFTWALGYAYDANGARSGIQYPSGTYIALDPNALGQATRVGNYVLGVTYHPNGSPVGFSYGNGVRFEQAFNIQQAPSSIGALPSVSSLAYAYDRVGNVTRITDMVSAGRDRQMSYDGLGRLVQATSPTFGGDGSLLYTYDVLDNIRSARVASGKDHTYVYDAKNRLTNVMSSQGATTIGLAYDAQGNLALRNGQPFIFDMGNRLRSTPGPENYRYDAEGRRVLAWLQGSGSILSMYDGDGKLRRQQSERDGKSREYLYVGGMLVATLETGTDGVTRPTYQHLDALGSPVAVTDASGTVVERSYYEPYGELRNRPLTDGIGYAGHVSDSANNLSYMQQRYYDPSIGIFLSVDPITALQKPASHFNRYRYANNNPYKFIDPNGEAGRVAWLVRLTANQANKVARITQEQAVAARRAGQNVVADRRQVASQIETAAHGRVDQLKHAAHELEDGSKGLPHYQTEGIRGHSFWGKLSVAALAAAGALEQVAEAAEYIPDPTPRPAEQADIDRWNNLMGTINKSTGIPMPGVKVGQDGGFQGYFNVGGRLDSKKLDEKLNGNR